MHWVGMFTINAALIIEMSKKRTQSRLKVKPRILTIASDYSKKENSS
jgi:hypothetical protein